MTASNRRGLQRKSGAVEPRARLSSVAKAIRLIKFFSDENYEIGISSLAQRLGLAKSTAHRLAAALVGEGLLEQNPRDGSYRLGLALFELGALVRRKMDVTAEAMPHLKALAKSTGETSHLAVLDHQGIVYINILESQRAIRMRYKVGTRAPLHCTAGGKVLLAFQSDLFIENTISGGLRAFTPATITKSPALHSELATIRTKGYAVENEEIELGVRGIAAAIRNDSGQVIASIGVAGPVHRLTKKLLPSYSDDLLAAAEAISQRLGYQPLRVIQPPIRLISNSNPKRDPIEQL